MRQAKARKPPHWQGVLHVVDEAASHEFPELGLPGSAAGCHAILVLEHRDDCPHQTTPVVVLLIRLRVVGRIMVLELPVLVQRPFAVFLELEAMRATVISFVGHPDIEPFPRAFRHLRSDPGVMVACDRDVDVEDRLDRVSTSNVVLSELDRLRVVSGGMIAIPSDDSTVTLACLGTLTRATAFWTVMKCGSLSKPKACRSPRISIAKDELALAGTEIGLRAIERDQLRLREGPADIRGGVVRTQRFASWRHVTVNCKS